MLLQHDQMLWLNDFLVLWMRQKFKIKIINTVWNCWHSLYDWSAHGESRALEWKLRHYGLDNLFRQATQHPPWEHRRPLLWSKPNFGEQALEWFSGAKWSNFPIILELHSFGALNRSHFWVRHLLLHRTTSINFSSDWTLTLILSIIVYRVVMQWQRRQFDNFYICGSINIKHTGHKNCCSSVMGYNHSNQL